MRSTRPLAVSAAVAILLALGGCGSDEPGSTATGGTTTGGATTEAGPTADAAAWAGGLCSAGDTLQESLDAVGSSLTVDPNSPFSSVEQVKSQLRDQAQEVARDAAALGDSIAALPPDVDPDVAAAGASLADSRAQLQESLDDLESAADTFDTASDVPSAVVAMAGVSAAFAAMRGDVANLRGDLEQLSTSSKSAVQQAFQDAPECAGYVSTS